ncbi:copper homeostasis protein CutC [Aeromonas simiae]|uniref:copper homeostasis protein CutC n=1 Tax=Aeromonas simiae TaxID=218936 RepID=UPI00266BE258|nr:copper homeostasis protein CutC [Aeromonas simiae]MDO2947035.1 copper homeostasis protein CutC [Aeromonas simiae]MDO2950647.1 copper homeostasis protein CutC [Aeromonas simiae]MDO2954371.1 copper homeostasis protein CutC [Aeromonas simiae]
MTKLEVCIDNLESLHTAQAAGADRIELCSALALGGLTPSFGLMQQAAHHARIPVYAMIRPRAGDFCFSDAELALMALDIAAARQAGLQGVVVGLLDDTGRVPGDALERLVQAAGPLGVTFHRAIDLSCDWRADLEVIVSAGCERILSSGQAASAEAGLQTLGEMQRQLAGRASLMPGAGVNAGNVQKILAACAVNEVHMSGMVWRGSALQSGVAMGSNDDGRINVVDADKIRAVRRLLG